MIRPRNSSPYHDYELVFQDLRDGTLSKADYDLMVEEDLTEASRRRAWVTYLRAEAIAEAWDESTGDSDVKMTGIQASRLNIRDEPSRAI